MTQKLYFSSLKQANKVEPHTCINTCILCFVYNYTPIQQGELAKDSERSASWHCSISSVEYRIQDLGHKTVDPTFQLGAFILVHFSMWNVHTALFQSLGMEEGGEWMKASVLITTNKAKTVL